MKIRTRAIIRERYDWDKVARTYEDLFKFLRRG